MKKFKDSKQSVVSDIMLWKEKPTQVMIKDTYQLKVHPVSSLYNEGSINFDIPSQPKGMISNVEITTSFKVKKGAANLTVENHCTVVNNFTNALWELVDVKVSDRVNLLQAARNSYSYSTFFNYALNSDANREDYLFNTQLFKMDSGTTKSDSESTVFSGDAIVNHGGAERAKRIANSRTVTVSSKLHCPLLESGKCLPTNMKIRVSLTKNSDKFLLIADANDYNIHISDVHLIVTFLKPHDIFLDLIEERLLKQPAPYFVTRPEIIIKPISQSGRVVRVNNLFQGKLPKHAVFCLQRSRDFDGDFNCNPFTFIPFGKFQLHVNGVPYFSDPLEIDYTTADGTKQYSENRSFLQQLYRTLGKDMRGCSLINSKNFQQNFMVAVSLTGDRASSSVGYLNVQTEASTQLELDFGYEINITDDLILIIYAVFDRVIKIAADRSIEIIE